MLTRLFRKSDGGTRLRGRPVVLCAVVAIVAVVVPASAQANIKTFLPSGGEQTFNVPAGVTSVHAVVVGGKGGDGAESGGAGGLGALAIADLAVTPGETLYVEVGGNGASGDAGGTGGFNGGGAGGAASDLSCDGGGGAGASDVRTLPRALATSLDLRLITAGGGGGGGGCTDPVAGAGPGGAAGAAGGTADGDGGQPGTSAGGGAGAGSVHCLGTAGGLGLGGAGGMSDCITAGGGGGGGGLYGGGGGQGDFAGGGGGGGSSGFGAGATNTSVASDLTGSPSITLAYTPSGGGGKPHPKKAALTGLGLTNKTFIVGKASTPLTGATTATAHKVGTTFLFRLNRAATVKIAIRRLASGRRVNGVCRSPSAKLRHHPSCTRTIAIVTLRRTARPGANKVAFTGRIHGNALQPGNYRAVFTALDTVGASSPKTLSFTIAMH
jgi:Glycine rich protein